MALISGLSSLSSTPRIPAARFGPAELISTVPTSPPRAINMARRTPAPSISPPKRLVAAVVGPVRAAGPGGGGQQQLSEKVAESVKQAEEACSGGDPASGECVAAWDEVEELSAAANHARDRKKDDDALENYCKDNPEADECRTYDN